MEFRLSKTKAVEKSEPINHIIHTHEMCATSFGYFRIARRSSPDDATESRRQPEVILLFAGDEVEEVVRNFFIVKRG